MAGNQPVIESPAPVAAPLSDDRPPVRDYSRAGWRGRLARILIGASVHTLFRVDVRGLQNLPSAGPYIVVANHRSWLDPFLMETVLPLEPRPYILGAKESIENRWWKRALLHFFGGSIPIERGRRVGDGSALGAARDVLAGGGVLVIFPEGTVAAEEGELRPVQRGIGHLTRQLRVPLAPVALSGTKDLYFRKTVQVEVGPAFIPAPGEGSLHDRIGAIVEEVDATLRAMIVPYHEPSARFKLFRHPLTHLFG